MVDAVSPSPVGWRCASTGSAGGADQASAPASKMPPAKSSASTGVPVNQSLIFVFAGARAVQRNSPVGGRAAVAQPEQGQDLAVGQVRVGVGEPGAVADGEFDVRPALPGMHDKTVLQRSFGRFRRRRHAPMLPDRRVRLHQDPFLERLRLPPSISKRIAADARSARLPDHADRLRPAPPQTTRRAGTRPHSGTAIRALIVLLAARGYATAVIAARVGVSIDTARKWRTRFAAPEWPA